MNIMFKKSHIFKRSLSQILKVSTIVVLLTSILTTAICAGEIKTDHQVSVVEATTSAMQLAQTFADGCDATEFMNAVMSDKMTLVEFLKEAQTHLYATFEDVNINVTLSVNGDTNVSAFIYEDTAYAPVRSVCEAFNYDVEWVQESRTVHIRNNEQKTQNVIHTRLNSIAQEAQPKNVTLEDVFFGVNVVCNDNVFKPAKTGARPAFMYNDTVYVPVREFCETLGKTVQWDGAKSMVIVNDAN